VDKNLHGNTLVRRHLSPILRDRAHRSREDGDAKLWYFLCKRRLNGFRFRHHRAVGPFIATFYCYEAQLIVEIHPKAHTEPHARAAEREAWLAKHRHHLLQFSQQDVQSDAVKVLEKILIACCERG
jgi:very-short-patch-repair endonuclease